MQLLISSQLRTSKSGILCTTSLCQLYISSGSFHYQRQLGCVGTAPYLYARRRSQAFY
ncbi:hypothetical protein PSCFBP3800_00416 [Pseudomonas syringae group genomosp. 3]|nr:hypothetical protein PSCFBP3800_00416 [Pseudomonas syringae group genomosp. 3]